MGAVAEGRAERSRAVRLLLACGAIGPLLFVAVFLVEGATRPGYSAWHHYVSELSLGPRGWVQVANFFVSGALVFAYAFGLKRALGAGEGSTWGPILLGAFGACLAGAGVFSCDPLLGYPPGAPATTTAHGSVHGLVSLVVFLSLIAACFVLARRFLGEPGWRAWGVYSMATGIVVAVFFVLFASLTTTAEATAPAGLYQRGAIITGWVWITAVALRLMRGQAAES